MDNFDFIADLKHKSLLERDFNELQECINHGLSKSAMILSGSIIEAVLLEFFTHNLPLGVSHNQLLKLSLNDLLLHAESAKLISSRSKELSLVIKDYRNLIHPGREIRTKEDFDIDTAIVAFSLVNIILKEIRENYLKQYGYKAEDIFNKIVVDSATYSIFSKLLIKLNNLEKMRLATMIVDFLIEHSKDNSAANFKKYLDLLKSEISNDDIHVFCKLLLKEVEQGKEENIVVLYELFGNNLGVLTDEEQELIMTYIYNIASNISPWAARITDYKFQRLFSYLGLYISNSVLKEKFFSLLISVVRYSGYAKGDKKKPYFTIYDNLLSNFSKDKIEKCKIFVIENLPNDVTDVFYREYDENDDLPF